MNKLSFFLLLFCIIQLFVVPFFSPVVAFTTNMSASVVVGQANFTARSSNGDTGVSAKGFNGPMGIASDGVKLLVSDYNNSRILLFTSIPTSNNASADIVIGQPDFTSNQENQGGSAGANTLDIPSGIDTDGTRIFIADTTNNRVLIYNTIPTSHNASADIVIGQPDFTTTTAGTSATSLSNPSDVDYDEVTGKLAIADNGNHRVLIYNKVPNANGVAADIVVGQSDFTTGTSGTSSTKFNSLWAVEFIDNKLIVGELSRVMTR